MSRGMRFGVVAGLVVAAGCRNITVYEDPIEEPVTSSSSSSGAGAPTACSELVWDRDEPLALDPLYGVQSKRAFVEGADGVRLVSLELHPDGSSTIVTTQVADPWGEGLTIAAPRDRGPITSGNLNVVPRADGSALLFSVQNEFHLHESVTYRVELPAGDGSASAEQTLESTLGVLTFASGRAVLARLETLEEGGNGYAWQQRLVFSDAQTDEVLFERDGQLIELAHWESSVGRGAYLSVSESKDYPAEYDETLRTWLVVEEGLLEADLSGFDSFGRTANGSVGIRSDDDGEEQVVALSDEGVPGAVALELPATDGHRQWQIVPWKDEHAIVRRRAREGEEEAALEVFVRADDGSQIASPPLVARRQTGVDVLLGPDGQSMLVAYGTWPADKGVRLARLVCR